MPDAGGLALGETAGLGRNIANSGDICLGSEAEGRVKARRTQQSLPVCAVCVANAGREGRGAGEDHVGQARRRLGKRRDCTLLYELYFYLSI